MHVVTALTMMLVTMAISSDKASRDGTVQMATYSHHKRVARGGWLDSASARDVCARI